MEPVGTELMINVFFAKNDYNNRKMILKLSVAQSELLKMVKSTHFYVTYENIVIF